MNRVLRQWVRQAVLVAVSALVGLAMPAASADSEVHGSLDTYAGGGVALVWAVLRAGANGDADVVVRIDSDARYRAVSVVGVDPFTHARTLLLPPTRLDAPFEFRIARARFADLPRTEWRFYGSAAPARDEAPALMVYYQGVPDTTPEFDDAAKLAAYLRARIAAARAGRAK